MRLHLTTVLACIALACCCLNTARSEQLRMALVISNGRYASMPALARCNASAATARDALRGRGFEVMERSDLGRGEFDTSIGALARRTRFCTFRFGRPLLLRLRIGIQRAMVPVAGVRRTRLRDYDVLTQGIYWQRAWSTA